MSDHNHHDMGHGGHHNHHMGHSDTGTSNVTTVMPFVNSSILPDHDGHNMHAGDHGAKHGTPGIHDAHNMMMRMYFHGGEDETILFEFWKISDIGGLIASMLVIFFLAFAYEALKFYREHLYRHSFHTVQYNTVSLPNENGGNIKETHKTVQLPSSNSPSFESFHQVEINPIFISQTTCNCSTSSNVAEVKANNNCLSPKIPNINTACDMGSAPIRLPTLHRAYKVKMFSWMHGWQTILHVIQVVLSYFLMLIFMTYNIWLCIAVALGAGAGYFFVGWKKSLVVDITEHCH